MAVGIGILHGFVQVLTRRRAGATVACLFSVLACGCASTQVAPDGVASYRYSSFDFSGKSWASQQRRCDALGMKPRHLGTDCGFWMCTSRYDCERK